MIDDPVGENLRLVYGGPTDGGAAAAAMPERLSTLIDELRRRQGVLPEARPLRQSVSRG